MRGVAGFAWVSFNDGMQIESFWQYWKVSQDPFNAEEARRDPVLLNLLDGQTAHPDFGKILGQPHEPTAAVVFGEKGSGKTALRVMLERRIAEHNAAYPELRAWVVLYDDMNKTLDRALAAIGRRKRKSEAALKHIRLVDHQDAILSSAVTALVDALLSGDDAKLGAKPMKTARRMPLTKRVDLAVLAAIYDQPATGSHARRWGALKRGLRLRSPRLLLARWMGLISAAAAIALGLAHHLTHSDDPIYLAVTGGLAALSILLLGYWAQGNLRLWRATARVARELRVLRVQRGDLRRWLASLPVREVAAAPLPTPADPERRYDLTRRLLGVIEAFGYRGLIVLVDRVDEPTAVSGDPMKMRDVVWPLLNNKFLQQDRVGIKLLLPIELRHVMMSEEGDFFSKARLDKQHMVEKLGWSGATLYDLCTRRIQACRDPKAEPLTLLQLFDDGVQKADLVDALEAMGRPRDAMKFLYHVVQAHCLSMPQEGPVKRISRQVLQQVRYEQTQRLQDVQRGLLPV